MSLGEPDFNTPPHIKAAGLRAIERDFTKYTEALPASAAGQPLGVDCAALLLPDLKLDYVAITCIARIDVATLQGVRRFSYLINTDKVFGTHSRLRAGSIKVIVYDEEIPLRYYTIDLIHPTREGHAMIAAALLPRVMAILDRRARRTELGRGRSGGVGYSKTGNSMMMKSICQFLLSCAALAAIALPVAKAETIAELYEKAKAEKEVVFYSGGPAAPHENRAKLFMQQFPGVTVNVTGGFSNVLNEQIEKQMAEKKLAVDLAFFQTVQDFVKWKKEEKLLHFKPDGFDQIYPTFKDPEGTYMALSANALTYAYNTAAVKPEDAPKSAQDFLKPMFAGKVITCYPADDDATLYLFHVIIQKYGWGWMDKYMANKPSFVQGHLAVARSVASGENIATFDASSSVWPFSRHGKLEVVWSPVDETPLFTLTGGIFKDAPHPNAAKLYLTWFLAKEQQSHVGSFSSRVDVPPPEGFKALTSYKLANAYREFMLEEKPISELRKRMEGYIGPPVNKGGVR